MSKTYEARPGQSPELLKKLHILTRDGKLNQDSRRKLKQIYHLFNFIEPILEKIITQNPSINLVDHGAGKSYLGFIIYDLFFRARQAAGQVIGIEVRPELVEKSRQLADELQFPSMHFLALNSASSLDHPSLPERIDLVTALHACDTATDEAIAFALHHQAPHIVLVPCCQAEVARHLRQSKGAQLYKPLSELWRHPIHTREFGSHITNVLRCLQLQAHGYQVTVTELTGWEHSMKNELIIAEYIGTIQTQAAERLQFLLDELGLQELQTRFFSSPRSAH